ncbi:MAG: hypothetical protein HYX90_01400 [Chloroflexi bacterium]|nr:hypothetical protein [Chloroflexota bacterium]
MEAPRKLRRSLWISSCTVFAFLAFSAALACSEKAKPPTPTPLSTPTTTPTPTFQQQRQLSVSFLRQLNQISNNLEGALESANVPQKIASGDLLQINAAITTLALQLDGFQRQVTELAVPAGMVDLAEIKGAELRAAEKIRQLFQGLRAAIQNGDRNEIQRAVFGLGQIENDPGIERPNKLQETLLAVFNIPDNEVNYRRQQ